MCLGGGAGWGTHLRSVEDVFEDVVEDVVEDAFAAGGGPNVHPEWIGGWGVTLEEMGGGGGLSLNHQTSGMCVWTGIGGKREIHTQWMEKEDERVRETGMGVSDWMLLEIEGGGRREQGAVIRDTREGESKRPRDRETFCTPLRYTCASVEERVGGAGGHDPSFSVPTPLLEVKEEAERDQTVGGGGTNCDDPSWLVGAGNL